MKHASTARQSTARCAKPLRECRNCCAARGGFEKDFMTGRKTRKKLRRPVGAGALSRGFSSFFGGVVLLFTGGFTWSGERSREFSSPFDGVVLLFTGGAVFLLSRKFSGALASVFGLSRKRSRRSPVAFSAAFS